MGTIKKRIIYLLITILLFKVTDFFFSVVENLSSELNAWLAVIIFYALFSLFEKKLIFCVEPCLFLFVNIFIFFSSMIWEYSIFLFTHYNETDMIWSYPPAFLGFTIYFFISLIHTICIILFNVKSSVSMRVDKYKELSKYVTATLVVPISFFAILVVIEIIGVWFYNDSEQFSYLIINLGKNIFAFYCLSELLTITDIIFKTVINIEK